MTSKARLSGVLWLAAALLAAAWPPAGARAAESPAPAKSEPDSAVPQRAFRFLAVADTHFWETEKHPKSLAAFKDFLEKVKPLAADFLVILGDVCGDRYAALPEARKIADDSGVKVYFVSGNHDDNYGNEPKHFEEAIGPHCYSFDHQGWHFACHWSQKPNLKWLEEDLAKRPAGSPVIFWQHYPPDGKVRAILEKHGAALAMSGHVHGHRTGMNGKLRDVTMDTFGAGFAVVDAFGDRKIRVNWRPRGISKSLTIVHPADGAEVAAGAATIAVNAFDSFREVVKVEYDAGSGPKLMRQDTDWSWSAPAELRGAGKLQVRATDTTGEVWTTASAWRGAASAPAVRPGTDWPVWGGAADNRRSTPDGIEPPLGLAWRAAVGGRCAQPVLAAGKVLVCTSTQDYEENNAVVCLEAATGRELWRAKLAGSPMCPPAASGGVVGAIDRFGRAYGFEAAGGKELWRVAGVPGTYETYGASGMITAADGVFYAGNLCALAAADGKQLWKALAAQYAIRPPAIADGRVLGAGTGYQLCLGAKDGKELWRSANSTYRASILAGDGAILGGRTVVRAADGTGARGVAVGGTGSDAALSADGKTLVQSDASGLAAFNLADGKILWRLPLKDGFASLTLGGKLAWPSTRDGAVRAVSLETGKGAWSFRVGSRLDAPVASGNALFLAGDDGCVYALAGAAAAGK